jgi:hypothetical protein
MEERDSVNNKFWNTSMSTTSSHSRPTEGQLKWALFNHKRVALEVRSYVQRLYLNPESVQDVPEYAKHSKLLDEYDSESIINDSTIPISDGRRAMLYLSEVAYRQRRQYISDNGFRYHRSTSDDESDQSIQNEHHILYNLHTNNSKRMIINNNGNVPTTARRKKIRRRRKKFQPRCSDPDRVRRFKEAFQAALHSLELSSVDVEERPIPTLDANSMSMESPEIIRRKWMRPETDESVHLGDTYTVYGCSTIPKRQPSVHNPTITSGKAPLDRSATWLNLLHGSQSKKNFRNNSATSRQYLIETNTPEHISQDQHNHWSQNNGSSRRLILSPELRLHVLEVAREIFSGGRDQKETISGKDYDVPVSPVSLDTLEHDINSFVDQFEQHLASGSINCNDDDENDDGSVVSSFSNPIFPSMTPGTILPVVTYDSDESIRDRCQINVSAISKCMNDSFTMMDSNFAPWTVSSSFIGTNDQQTSKSGCTDHIDNDICIDVQQQEISNSDGKESLTTIDQVEIEKSSPHCIRDRFDGNVLDLSPLNLKYFLRVLPDNNSIIYTVTPTTFDNVRVDGNMNDVKKIHEENCDVKPIPRNKSNTKETLPMMFCQNKQPVYSNTTSNDTKDNYATTSTTPSSSSVSNSAGCGLFTQRFDSQWEKRLML